MLKNRKLWFKIGGGFAFVIFSQIFVGAFGLSIVGSFVGRQQAIDNLHQFSNCIYQARQIEQRIVHSRDQQGDEGLLDLKRRVAELGRETRFRLRAAQAQAQLDEIMRSFDAYAGALARYEAKRAASATDPREMQSMQQGLEDTAAKIMARNTGLIEHQKQRMYSEIRNTAILVVAGATTVMVIGMLMAILITRGITCSMGKGVDFASKVAEGDLDVDLDIDQRDEIGILADSMRIMVLNLNRIIAEVRAAAGNVSAGSLEMNAMSDEVSRGAARQAALLGDITATIGQMTSSIKHNASHAETGMLKARETVGALETNAGVSRELARAMEGISAASSKIGNITVTVNEVAFQTNLLALNAAVEAARAGEHGQGFAVVAAEVRALARRSSEAAAQIRDLIEDTVSRIRAGDEMVKKSEDSLGQIICLMQGLSHMIEEMAAASTQQAAGVDELNLAVSQIDAQTRHNRDTVERLTDTAQGMSNETSHLAESVERFRTRT